MEKRDFSFTFSATMLGVILIVANGLWLAYGGSPIVVHSFPVGSVSEILNTGIFWGRVSFGFKGAAEIYSLAVLACLIIIMLYCSFKIRGSPRIHRTYGPIIAVLSLLSLPFGGGFYIGSILAFIAGVAALEWPKPFKETFFGNLLSAGRASTGFFTSLPLSSGLMARAAFSVAFVGFVVGLGTGLYVYNSSFITTMGDQATSILLGGQILWTETVFITSMSLVTTTLLKWLVLSACIFWIGSRLKGTDTPYNTVAQTLAYCYAPLLLEAFTPILFANEPTLSFNWPVGLYVISRLWLLVLLFTAVNGIFNLSRREALGVVLFSGLIYWVVIHAVIFPVLNVPGIQIAVSLPQSSSFVLFTGGVIVAFSFLLGVFTGKQ